MMRSSFLYNFNSNIYYSPYDKIWDSLTKDDLVYKKKKVWYINKPAAFDIETSSFLEDGEKKALTYMWSFGYNGKVMIGRTWSDFIKVLDRLVDDLEINFNKRLIIYVHNLAYEFQFMYKYFEFAKVFAIKQRTPIYAITTSGIEFRCSYILTGYSLEVLANNLLKYNVKKLVGNLDYDLIRTPFTRLSDDEIDYSINDVKIVMAAIQEKIEREGDITKIPLTKTGYARNYARSCCLDEEGVSRKKSRKFWNYRRLMSILTLEPREIRLNMRAFMGGYTHTSPDKSGRIIDDADSIDESSAYPYHLVAFKRYPMGKGKWIKIESMDDFLYNIKYYACIFNIRFENLRPIFFYDNYISSARSFNHHNVTTQNGRVVTADSIDLTITEIDFEIIKATYTWDKIYIGDFIRYPRGYLPTDLVAAILKLYKDKTELKNVDGKEAEYLSGKELLNSIYGMMVTNIIRDDITFDGELWGLSPKSTDEEIEKYNKSFSRFLFYPWGVYCTALSRRSLWKGILEFGDDYLYCDTDSIKCKNYINHKEWVDKYNENCGKLLEKALNYHGLPLELVRPKTVKGVEKPLGVWDYEGKYKRFKAIRAKSYMYEYEDGKLSFTIAGLNKKVVVPFLTKNHSNDDIFKMFKEGLYIDEEHTGKLTHTYIDDVMEGDIIDYLGKPYHYKELSGINLSKQPFELSIPAEYLRYIKDIQFNKGGK